MSEKLRFHMQSMDIQGKTPVKVELQKIDFKKMGEELKNLRRNVSRKAKQHSKSKE